MAERGDGKIVRSLYVPERYARVRASLSFAPWLFVVSRIADLPTPVMLRTGICRGVMVVS
jgi:hypothetical protein